MAELGERFWSKVQRGEPDACWLWQASKDEKGYGLYKVNGILIRAHRYVLIAAGHDMRGRVSRHTCDTPSCVNLKHLQPGTHAENVADCKARNRLSARDGENNNFAKLTAAQVGALRAAYATLPRGPKGFCVSGSAKALAAKFGVTYRTLKQIADYHSWRADVRIS